MAEAEAHTQMGAGDPVLPRPLFGGAMEAALPARFQDVADMREVPDNQEAFCDFARGESLIVELLELKEDVADHESALWFFHNLAREQDADPSTVLETMSPLSLQDVPHVDATATKNMAIGKMAVAVGRQGVDARNIIRCYIGNIRLQNVRTDVLITLNEPLFISRNSLLAETLDYGETVPASAAGCLPAREVFSAFLASFRIIDWGLFRS